jgi:presenilin-like A22 family membrane protease
MGNQSRLDPFFGSSVIFIICQALTFLVVSQVKAFIEANQIAVPQVSTGFAVLYFLGVVAVMGIILSLIPISILRLVLKALFAFLYSWGVFVFLGLYLPVIAAMLVATALGLIWFFQPRIWLHNLLLIFSLVSLGATLGPLFSPWAVSLLLGILSIYDLVAVGSGYMIWMVKQLALSETLPAFLIPRRLISWNMTFKEAGVTNLLNDESRHRELSVLGGGDLGLPLVLITSVYFTYGFLSALIVAVFSFIGLFFAYFIQIYILKGKPLPALPPISLVSFIGFLVALLVKT